MTIFEKYLGSVSRAAFQKLGIFGKYNVRLFLRRCVRGFVLPVLEYCSAAWCSADDTHLKLLDRVVSDVSFSTAWWCVRV